MGTARVQHTYNHFNGLPEDGVVNTFYFEKIPTDFGVSVTDAEALVALVTAFYDTPAVGGGVAICQNIAEVTMTPFRHGFKVYDEFAPKPSVPVLQTTTQNGRTNLGAAAMPAEVALCMSYRGPLVSGVPAAQRRGRIYLGPLTQSSGEAETSSKHVRPGAWRDNVIASGKKLATSAVTAGFRWCVKHSALGEGGTNGSIYTPITHVWVDNAFDTQRRRGPKATSRVSVDFVADIPGS